MDLDCYKYIDGLWMHGMFDDDIVRSVLSYKPRPDDVFIATYPKCGTTWTQYLILSIISRAQPPKTLADFMLASPFLELMGVEAADKMPRPGLLKMHLPFDKAPYSTDAKYVYVARNPYDVCVSFYYHTKGFTPKRVKDASFEAFHEMFITGKLSYGDFFDHLLSWYEKRNNPNILFFTYEEMKKDTRFWALKIADFLGEQYGNELLSNPTLLRKVLDAASFESMKGVFTDKIGTSIIVLLDLPPEKALKTVEVYRSSWSETEEMYEDEGFVRKGVVGDWKAHFTPELISKTKAWIAQKTHGSDVMQLWDDIDMP
ncbi:hypothetical protein HPB49_000486 [Dermacentor silvarum]|uniref:Uncharacterized protein n=1 Tax=Dermacentor silvarum TaxID=543639 RepID=A0ACB8CCS6_DERSI|nr:sulfotransferase 1E1 [Dermacentor silvarum]KAH7940487.1 hypothetical protein HPB49_000486 [Dermacentor silvarum]